MTAPDRIQITYQDPMITPDFRALCAELLQAWQFGDDIAGPMNRARTALQAEPEGEGPSETDLYDLAAEFNGDPVPAMRRALELWGNPLQGAPAPGENLATPPAPEPGEAIQPTGRSGLTWEAAINGLRDVLADQTEDAIQRVWQRSRIVTAMDLMAANTPTPPSPVPGDVAELVAWLKEEAEAYRNTCGTNLASRNLDNAAALVLLQEAELATLRQQPHPTYLDAIRLAEGCHDYSGGHTGAEGEAWHGAIDTVVDVLKKATDGPWDSQTKAVYGVGSEAQAGEVAVPVPVPVAWCRSDEFANSMNRGGSFNGWKDPGAGPNKCDMQLYAIPLPAPQAGDVEA